MQAANKKTISRNIKIRNSGAVEGKFIFNYKGEHSITFNPNEGTVPSYSSITVRV